LRETLCWAVQGTSTAWQHLMPTLRPGCVSLPVMCFGPALSVLWPAHGCLCCVCSATSGAEERAAQSRHLGWLPGVLQPTRNFRALLLATLQQSLQDIRIQRASCNQRNDFHCHYCMLCVACAVVLHVPLWKPASLLSLSTFKPYRRCLGWMLKLGAHSMAGYLSNG